MASSSYSYTASELTDGRMPLGGSRPTRERTSQSNLAVVASPSASVAYLPEPQAEQEPPLQGVVMLSAPERARAMLTIQMVNLQSILSPDEYVRTFGRVSAYAPYGEHVWEGLKGALGRWRLAGGLPGWRSADLRLGWFRAPQRFSRNNAYTPVEDDDDLIYPTVYARDVSGEVYTYIWCLNIIVYRTRAWRVHHSRVITLMDYNDSVEY